MAVFQVKIKAILEKAFIRDHKVIFSTKKCHSLSSDYRLLVELWCNFQKTHSLPSLVYVPKCNTTVKLLNNLNFLPQVL